MIKLGFSEDSEKLSIVRLSGMIVGITLLLHIFLDYLFIYHSLKFQNHTTIIVEIAVGIFIGFSLHIWNQKQQKEIKDIGEKNTALISKINEFLDKQTKLQTDREHAAYITMEKHLREVYIEFQLMIDVWNKNHLKKHDIDFKTEIEFHFQQIQEEYDRFYKIFSQSTSILYGGHIEDMNNLHDKFSQRIRIAKIGMSLRFAKSAHEVIKEYLDFLKPSIVQIIRDINTETVKEIESKRSDSTESKNE